MSVADFRHSNTIIMGTGVREKGKYLFAYRHSGQLDQWAVEEVTWQAGKASDSRVPVAAGLSEKMAQQRIDVYNAKIASEGNTVLDINEIAIAGIAKGRKTVLDISYFKRPEKIGLAAS